MREQKILHWMSVKTYFSQRRKQDIFSVLKQLGPALVTVWPKRIHINKDNNNNNDNNNNVDSNKNNEKDSNMYMYVLLNEYRDL